MVRFFSILERTFSSTPSQPSSTSIKLSRGAKPEPSNGYKVGGYHPVRLYQVYHQRYQVVHQLGWGTCSTVWLVNDVRTQQPAALKILVADLTDHKPIRDELAMLKALRNGGPDSPGRHHVCQLLDNFTEAGPNGIHDCLVFEALAVNLLDLERALSQRAPAGRSSSAPRGLPLPLLKRVFSHVLLALQYTHECGLVHTDIKGDNILMAGTPLPMGQDSSDLDLDALLSATFKLADFGAANLASQRFANVIQPQKLRSPEVIIGAEWGTKADIWNFGCLLFEFATGKLLFPDIRQKGSKTVFETAHLVQIIRLFGPFPRASLATGKRAHRYFDDQGCLMTDSTAPGELKFDETLANLLRSTKYPRAELDGLADVLSHALVVDPAARWPADQLLSHPWLADCPQPQRS